MAKVNNIAPHATAVAYTRRSTDKQEMSIEEQAAAIQRFADEKGYALIRWYTDDAVSGDDTKNRHDFQRMLADAQQRKDFKFIICWDQSRFGRFNPQEAGYWTYQFAEAGVGLVTTDKGLIDWNDFTGWLTYSVDQHAKHQFLVNLSRDVVRGQTEAASKGSWLGLPPYGYRIEGERKNKRLVIESEGKVNVVRRIFREFVTEGRSLADIARRLQKDGIVPPGEGRPWRYDTVRTILGNPAYAGDYASGRVRYAKYHVVQDGRPVRVTGPRKHVINPEEKWIIRRDNHEAIVDRETFDRARELLAPNRVGVRRFTPETNPFALNGLLRCGKCGCPMWGDTVKGRKFYRCGNWQTNGVTACEGTKVSEPVILNGVADHLEKWLGTEAEGLDTVAYYGHLSPDDKLPEVFEKVKKLVIPPPRPKRDRERLKKRVDELAAKITKARNNLALLDPENIPAAQDKIRALDAERADLDKELQQAKPPSEQNINEVVMAVFHSLYSLAYCCRSLAKPSAFDGQERRGVENPDGSITTGSLEMAAPGHVRRFFSHASHIVCHSEKRGTGRGTRHEFVRGEIVFREVGVARSESNLTSRNPYSVSFTISFGPKAEG